MLRTATRPAAGAELSKFVSGCRFCDRVQGIAASDWSVQHAGAGHVVVPSLGALVPGWLLAVPTRHVLSLATMDGPELADLLAGVERMRPTWAGVFGEAFLFEHGPSEPETCVGCGVDHAHLHVVPTRGVDLLAAAREDLPWLDWRAIPRIDDVRHLTDGQPYLVLQTPDRRAWLATGGDIPSQALRRSLATRLGCATEYDWKQHPRREIVDVTIRELQRSAS